MSDDIERRFTEHITEIGGIPVARALAVWETDVDTLHTPFGYSRPVWVDDRSYIAFCPELIQRTTATLSATDLSDYLTCVFVQLDYYVSHHEMDDEEATEWFDRYVSDAFLGSLALMNEVQLSWLDKRAAT